ncbi:MAG: hypothetical protein KF709_01285 [Gemmatimonadaceae bacterium]|nr:hypothetical protein [Gemmatimonadaceae bacterium]
MTRFSLPLLILAAALSGCLKRKPPETIPDATLPDGTPVVQADSGPRPQVIVPTSAENESPYFVQALVSSHITTNSIRGSGFFETPTYKGAMVGVEGSIQPLHGRGLGVGGRVISAGQSTPAYSDIELLLGQRELAVGLGLGYRQGLDLTNHRAYDSTFAFFSPSIRSRVNLGDGGFSLASRLVRYFGLPESRTPKPQLWGWHIEESLAWTASRLPITAMVGFRHEQFRVYREKHTLNSLVIGGGIIFGRKPGALVSVDTVRNR